MKSVLVTTTRLSSSKWMANLAGAYVNYFRSIPLLLVITWFYLAVPFVLRWITRAGKPENTQMSFLPEPSV